MGKMVLKKMFLSMAALALSASMAWAGSASGIEVRVCGGMVSPVSDGLYQYFKADVSFGGSLGYKLDDQFSLLLDCQYNALEFAPGGISPAKVSNFSTLEVTIVEKLRVGSNTKIKPYFFLGEGVAFTTFANPVWGNTANEISPLVAAGMGLDFAMVEQFSVFLQTKMTLALTAESVSPDKLTFYIPIQAGLAYSL